MVMILSVHGDGDVDRCSNSVNSGDVLVMLILLAADVMGVVV